MLLRTPPPEMVKAFSRNRPGQVAFHCRFGRATLAATLRDFISGVAGPRFRSSFRGCLERVGASVCSVDIHHDYKSGRAVQSIVGIPIVGRIEWEVGAGIGVIQLSDPTVSSVPLMTSARTRGIISACSTDPVARRTPLPCKSRL